MAFVGMDFESVERFAAQLAKAAGDLQRVSADVSRQVADVMWQGKDAEQFKGNWASEQKRALNQVVELLNNTSQQVKKELAQQRQASGG